MNLPLLVEPPRITLQYSASEDLSDVRAIRTPSDYFTYRYQELAQKFGPPVLEQHWLDNNGGLHVTPVQVNEDFFAAVIGGAGRNSKVIFYEPEHLFYYHDPLLGHYAVTSEEKLKLGLSQEFIKCASFFSQRFGDVDIRPLFQSFRSDETLDAIIERSKALLGRDQSFFADGTGNRKDPVRLSGEQTAKLFVAEAITAMPGGILKLADAYNRYWSYCDLKSLPAIDRRKFREPSATAIKAKFGKGLRSDLKLDGKWIDGWKDLRVSDALVTG